MKKKYLCLFDFTVPDNIYVFQNTYPISSSNALGITSLPFDLKDKTNTYAKPFGVCTIDY